MKPKRTEEDFCGVSVEGFALSNASLLELMQASFAKGAHFRFKATGFSMAPFIRDGDIVTLYALPAGKKILGIPVAFISPATGKLAIHRVILYSGGSYSIKGDNIFCSDGRVKRGDIFAFVAGVERNGRKVYLGLGPERFLVALLSLIKVLPVVLWSKRLLGGYKRRRIQP